MSKKTKPTIITRNTDSSSSSSSSFSVPLPKKPLTGENVKELVRYVVKLACKSGKKRLVGSFLCSFEQFGVDKVVFLLLFVILLVCSLFVVCLLFFVFVCFVLVFIIIFL